MFCNCCDSMNIQYVYIYISKMHTRDYGLSWKYHIPSNCLLKFNSMKFDRKIELRTECY